MALLEDEINNNENSNVEQEETNIVEEQIVEDAETSKQTVQPLKKSKNGKENKVAGTVKGAFSELKKVSWPGFKKVVKETIVVLSVTAVFLVVIFGLDQLLYYLFTLLTGNL